MTPACPPVRWTYPEEVQTSVFSTVDVTDRGSVDPETASAPPAAGARSYEVRTHGCQMNVHDSERLSGLLEEAGYVPADAGTDADLVVFNTCAVRENADNKLYGNLGMLRPAKTRNPNMQIAVGGCLAQ